MRILLVLVSFLFLEACTKPVATIPVVGPVVCAIETTVTGALTAAIKTTLNCKNAAQIQTDILAVVGLTNMCQNTTNAVAVSAQNPNGLVGNIVCPLAVNAVLSLLTAQVPSTWGCSTTSTSLSSVLTAACTAVVPI